MANPPLPVNWRNGAGTQCPPLMTAKDNSYQAGVWIKNSDWHVIAFHRSISTGAILRQNDLGLIPALVSYGITPIKSDALGGDVHYSICNGLDDIFRTWVAGNSLAETPHLMYSAPNSTSSWTTIPWASHPVNLAGTGGAYCTYQNFQSLSNGQLILHCDQRDAGGLAEGKDNLAFILPTGGSTTWQPLVGTGEFLTSEPASGPQRVYLTGCFTEQIPHKDRVWISFVYRHDWTQVNTTYDFGILYNDTVTNASTWKRIDGTSQTMPVSYANVTGTSALVPLPSGQTYWNITGQISVDFNGHPHIITGPGGTNRHVWHDGTTWQYENVSSTSPTPAPFTLRNGTTMMYRMFNGRLVVSRITFGEPSFICGNPIPTTYTQPYADPVQMAKGVLHILNGDGDVPDVCTFGDHAARAYAV